MNSLFRAIFGSRKPSSAAVAKDRLQLIIRREHSGHSDAPDFLPNLQQELLEVIVKYVKVERESIKVELDRSDNLDLLAINIVLPEAPRSASVEPEAVAAH